MAADEEAFGPVDYLVFALFLLMSVGIGVYHAWRAWQNRRKRETEIMATTDFLMGGRQMPILPISLSLLTTFLSGITLLGTPAEIFSLGLLFWVYYMAAPFAFAVSGFFFVPIFYKLGSISIYEYFEYRFDSRVLRRVAAGLFLINSLFYMSIVIYAPSVAIGAISGSKYGYFILVVGLCCTLYTSIGGLKAVVWADTLQSIFMYGGIGILIIKGTIDAGGVGSVFETASLSKRIDALARIDPNPAQQNSLWISIFGAWSFWMSLYGLNQMALQRYCSLPSLRHARIVIAITIPCFIVLGTMACYIGMVMLAHFYDCDPLVTKEATHKDQLVILFATKMLSIVKGLPGLFMACLFSCTLSTISSGMNSMAAVTWEDFLKYYIGHKFNDDQAANISKLLVVIFGLLATGLAFTAEALGGIIKAALSVMGAIAGPLIGLFFLGVFVRKSNELGAFVGIAVSGIFNVFICLGNFLNNPYKGYTLATNTTCGGDCKCPVNGTELPTMWQYDPHYGNPEVFYLFRISPYLYPLIGMLLVVIVGAIASYVMPEREMEKPEKRQRHFSLTYFGREAPVPEELDHRAVEQLEEQKAVRQRSMSTEEEQTRF